ncbi:Asp-tRNAAsn/Glu-tRNAGln amidotransferase A subunit [Chryseolinea serpens]|uniref:Asp-tRNAAsn/Glu-tRNAGln amidotransferase A subunit n=1 Tax=Chryseolinea serpens TaxID=947013 RepID=A0A1M5TN48_9BACT|nr:amidase [Chryseolinea serpens]SHH51793.1 Asp-tRNAAsn/Glu-tRNAGln amidotransferase A subunit [Chryseolinea serpens]
MEKEKYGYMSIMEASEKIKRGMVSPVALVNECVTRIAQLNPTLNAFITVLSDEALKQAAVAEAEIKKGQWRGPLHGIPVAVKDFYDTAGIRTTAGFVHFKDRVPAKDAVMVEKLKAAGAIVVGKTNMHELGMGTTSVISYFGSVHNPWNVAYVAGGSSGGSAAAVASGMCYATVDTDAVGSCRLPASCCGVTGFKATYGLMSGQGILEGERADETILKLAHVGITTRWVADTAILLNALADNSKRQYKDDYRMAFASGKKYRIGVVRNFEATADVRDLFYAVVEGLKESKHIFTETDVPFASAVFDVRTIDADREKINAKLFKDIDLLLLPTTTDLTPTLEAAQKSGPQAVSPNNTFFANYFGLPAISIPCGMDKNNMPSGLQLVGRAGEEDTVLDAAKDFQEKLPVAYPA